MGHTERTVKQGTQTPGVSNPSGEDSLTDPLQSTDLGVFDTYDDLSSTQGALQLSKLGQRVQHTAQAPLELLGLSDTMIRGGNSDDPPGDRDVPFPTEQGPREIAHNVFREELLARQFKGLGLSLRGEAGKKRAKRQTQLGRDGEGPQDQGERNLAIGGSGIVPSHAEAISDVSTLRGEIIITRPVNKDCTDLIGQGAATKHLHIKSKSTDWGPAAGYIPRDGRYSKLGNPKTQGELAIQGMKDSSTAAEKAIQEGWCIPLTMVHTNGKNRAIAGNPAQGDEVWIIPEGSSEESWDKLTQVKAPERVAPDQIPSGFKPLQVLGDPSSKQPIAADYDIFAIGPRKEKVQKEKHKNAIQYKTDRHMGKITDLQKSTVMDINAGVMTTGHEGGRVAHHGAETQNPVTELDFPLTAFEPDGSVASIKNQLELVDYFNRMVKQGYDLEPNEKWLTDPPKSSGLWKWSKWTGSPGSWKIDPQDHHQVKGEA